MRFFTLLLCALLISGCKTSNRVKVPMSPLQSCLKRVDREHTSCILRSFAGTSGLSSPVAAKRREICEDRRYKYEDRCYQRFQ